MTVPARLTSPLFRFAVPPPASVSRYGPRSSSSTAWPGCSASSAAWMVLNCPRPSCETVSSVRPSSHFSNGGGSLAHLFGSRRHEGLGRYVGGSLIDARIGGAQTRSGGSLRRRPPSSAEFGLVAHVEPIWHDGNRRRSSSSGPSGLVERVGSISHEGH